MKRQVAFMVALGVGVSIGTAGAKELKIGVIDSFEVMRTSKDGIAAGKELETKRESLSKDLQRDQEALMQVGNALKSKASTLSQEARDKEEQKIVKMQRDLEAKAQECEEEMRLAMQRTTERLAQDVEKAARDVALEQGLDEVIDKMTGRVIYHKTEFDYTVQATQKMDKSYEQRLAQNKDGEKKTTTA